MLLRAFLWFKPCVSNCLTSVYPKGYLTICMNQNTYKHQYILTNTHTTLKNANANSAHTLAYSLVVCTRILHAIPIQAKQSCNKKKKKKQLEGRHFGQQLKIATTCMIKKVYKAIQDNCCTQVHFEQSGNRGNYLLNKLITLKHFRYFYNHEIYLLTLIIIFINTTTTQ